MTTAGEIDTRQRRRFAEALQAKLGRNINREFALTGRLLAALSSVPATGS